MAEPSGKFLIFHNFFYEPDNVNESDPRSNVHYLGSDEK